jgi:hypothetical protein
MMDSSPVARWRSRFHLVTSARSLSSARRRGSINSQDLPADRPPRFRLELRYDVWMIQRPKWLQMSHLARSAAVAVVLAGIFLTVFTLPADARGGHGFSNHDAEFAGGRRRGNDNYVKAASDERDKLLNTKLKSICRGC